MKIDGSDVTAVLAIGLSAAFATVATGSITLGSAEHDHDRQHVVTEVVVGQDARAEREVRQELRSVVVRGVPEVAVDASVRPVIYVDGVRVEEDMAEISENLSPNDIASIDVVRVGDQGREIRIVLKRER